MKPEPDVITDEATAEASAATTARSSVLNWLITLVSCVGLFDAVLLTLEHYTKQNLPCTFTNACETVLTSRYAMVGPIPMAALGVVFYGVIVFAGVYALSNRTALPRQLLLGWTGLGFLSSLGLTYIEAFVIHAWCQYCLLSALCSTVLFGLATYYYSRKDI